jgi:hypothetical protein
MKNTQQFDPIVSVALMPVFGGIAAAASPDTHTASVFVAVNEGADEAATGGGIAPTLRDRLRRRYWRYEMDLTHHPVVLRFSLPAKEEAFAFTATVTLLWAVQNPVEVALLGVRDLKPVLWTFLDQTLRGVSRNFSIEEVRHAEAEMRLTLEKQSGEVGFGLRLPMVAVSLRLDEDTERYLSQRVQSGRQGNLAVDRHDLARKEAEHEKQQANWRNHLEQAQAQWRGELEQAQARHRRELDAEQARHTHEIERLNSEHETALKEQRLSFYGNALNGGNHDIMMLQLMENPSDIGAVLRLFEAGDAKHYERSREILDKMLQNQLANASDVDGLIHHTIDQLRSALTAAAPRTSTVMAERVDEHVRTESEKHTARVIRQTNT